ncbi:hypothetical protein KRR39_04090 [Nocardioides panacis]|uniref:Uncharacterized protein n=1 Tax=Nocardioides panacis TaxID=2849501 RepID=A0A975T020_9ACTN|nr:hypothetical protein [Nocardioides panacis]QWZ09016.1 hypothetical protein KRR39_04090 [Nocardioides panacis]
MGTLGADTSEDCRCTIGEDHNDYGVLMAEVNFGQDDDQDDGDRDSDETLNVYDAADIWMSHGMDEDYTFGYSEDELRRAAGR